MSISFADYKRIGAVNNSSLKEMAKSPKHYRHYVDHPEDPDKAPTDAMTLGSATHCGILEPDLMPRKFAIWEDGRRAGKAWDTFVDANEGKELIRLVDYEKALAIRDAVRANPTIRPYLEGFGDFERSIQWTDEETLLACKAMIDRLAHETRFGRVLVELKTTRTADRRKFANQAAELGYAQQLAMYRDGMAAVGEPVDKAVIVLVENYAPYDSCVLVVGSDTLQAGRSDYRKLLLRVAECQASGKWPGRFPDEDELAMPAWWWADDESEDGLDINMEEMA